MAAAPDLNLTALQLDRLRLALGYFTAATRGRGRLYYEQNRVDLVHGDDECVTAVVVGNDAYEVDWFWDEEGCTCACTCPVGLDCKHAYATGLYILAHVTSKAETFVAPVAATRRYDLAEVLARDNNPWRRREIVRGMLTGPPLHFGPYDERLMDLLDASQAEPDAELLCALLAQRISALTNGVLPPELKPYHNRTDLQERLVTRERDRLANDLLTWVAGKKAPPPRSLRFVWSLVPTPSDAVSLLCEARLTTNRLRDEPRSFEQIRQLHGEAHRHPGTLPDLQYALADSYLDTLNRLSLAYSRSVGGTELAVAMLKTADRESAHMTWALDVDPATSRRAGIVAGEPLRLAPHPLRILPAATAVNDGARVELVCLWPDGRQRLFSDVLYFAGNEIVHTPSVVLADGVFFTVSEEPPAAVRNRLLSLGGLEVPRAQCAEVLTPLAQHFEHVRASLAARTRWIKRKPTVALDLRDDDWLQIRVFVNDDDEPWVPHQSSPEKGVYELGPDERWQRLHERPTNRDEEEVGVYGPIHSIGESLPAATESDDVGEPRLADQHVWIEAPDPETVAPALAWLAATEAHPGTKGGPGGTLPQAPDRGVGWWMKASARRMAAFAELWQTRPAAVHFFGTERVRRLLSGAQTVRPKLNIKSSGLDWFAVSAAWESEGLSLNDADMAKLRSATSRFVKLASGWVQRDAVEAHDQAAAVLADLGIEVGGGEQRVTLWQLAGAKAESVAALEQMGADRQAIKALSNLRQRLRKFEGVPEVAVPAAITADLRPYQKRGLDFLVYTSSVGIGTVLADDMGLGKTLQALAWLQTLVSQKPKAGPSLVVCPTSVMHNWQREAAQFAPKLRVLALTRGEERHELRKEIGRYDLVVTNYALLRRDLEQWKEVKLRAVILDEAQNIKNPDAAVSRAACALQAQHRLALTGTPLENRPLDLWSILNFVNPGYLGNRTQFSMRFDRVEAAPHARTLLAAKLRPVLLRRLKREVAADLPERIEERRDCELTPGQRQLYLAELRRSRKLIDKLSEDASSLRKNKITILAALTRLRQICCHPVLAKGKASLGSGKFEALFELLEPLIEEGHKVLLFSQFVQCLSLIEVEMAQRGIAYHKLTGATMKREAVVKAFQEDPRACVFLVSLKAGGTGLNLTAASYVVLFDPWWNPAVEAQAIDRTHRIGQDRTVIAYRMLALGTIEERIWELQQRKSAMVRDILGEDGFARALSRDDLSFLLQDV